MQRQKVGAWSLDSSFINLFCVFVVVCFWHTFLNRMPCMCHTTQPKRNDKWEQTVHVSNLRSEPEHRSEQTKYLTHSPTYWVAGEDITDSERYHECDIPLAGTAKGSNQLHRATIITCQLSSVSFCVSVLHACTFVWLANQLHWQISSLCLQKTR